MEDSGKALIVATCWGVWKGSCDWVFNATQVNPMKIIESVAALVDESWRTISIEEKFVKRLARTRISINECWRPPAKDKVKINTDAVFSGSSNNASFGIVYKNVEGRFVGGLSRRIVANTAFMAEGLIVRQAVLLRNRFEGKIYIETNCEGLITCISANSVEACKW